MTDLDTALTALDPAELDTFTRAVAQTRDAAVEDGRPVMAAVWADDFALNQVRGRAEIRAEVEVYRPSGIINCDLTAI